MLSQGVRAGPSLAPRGLAPRVAAMPVGAVCRRGALSRRARSGRRRSGRMRAYGRAGTSPASRSMQSAARAAGTLGSSQPAAPVPDRRPCRAAARPQRAHSARPPQCTRRAWPPRAQPGLAQCQAPCARARGAQSPDARMLLHAPLRCNALPARLCRARSPVRAHSARSARDMRRTYRRAQALRGSPRSGSERPARGPARGAQTRRAPAPPRPARRPPAGSARSAEWHQSELASRAQRLHSVRQTVTKQSHVTRRGTPACACPAGRRTCADARRRRL